MVFEERLLERNYSESVFKSLVVTHMDVKDGDVTRAIMIVKEQLEKVMDELERYYENNLSCIHGNFRE